MQANDRFLEDEKQTFRISLYIYLLIFLVVVILASINKYWNGAADKLKLYLLLKLEQIILKAKAIILRRNIGKQLLYKYIDNNGEENYVSDGNDTIHPLNVEGNQINNQNTTQRRITLRRLLRNNPIIASNIETIAQQFGQEAEEGLRIIIENRRAQDVNWIMSRMNITELRSYIPDKYLGTFDEENAQYLRTIVNWYGQTAGILQLFLTY